MLRYKLIQKPDPRDRLKPQKWYAIPVLRGHKDLSEISRDVSGASSLSRGDIRNVILSLVDQLPKYLLDGQSVGLGELGTIRISFGSAGVDDPDDFSIADIESLKIVFIPGMELKKTLARANFEGIRE